MKKHYGKGGLGVVDDGDIATDSYNAGYVDGLKRALAIVAENTNRASAYKKIRLIVRRYGDESPQYWRDTAAKK